MKFRVLGPLEVGCDGRWMTLRRSKQRALLAVLITHAPRSRSPDALIDALWGDTPPATAKKTLQTYVSQLRAALARDDPTGRETLVTDTVGYRLAIDAGDVDAKRFERALDDGRAALATDPERARRRLTEALAMWRGRAYADVTGVVLAEDEARRLDELRLEAVEARADADLSLGADARVRCEVGALARRYPFRERFWEQLVVALYRSGRRADALRTYEEAEETLEHELGLGAGRRLRELNELMVANDPLLELHPRDPARR